MIGIFDSGLGGLTAVREIAERLPSEDIVYFGDTGRVPYGTRSAETIIKYSIEDMNFLSSFGVDCILVACGTVSSTALSELRSRSDVNVYGVIAPSVIAAAKATKNKKIGVISTSATLRSGAFDRELYKIDPSISVYSAACPLFVPLVENGFVQDDCEITRLAAEHYLAKIRESGADTLILGCTHYPIIAGIISKVLPGVTLISSGAEAAKKALEVLGKKEHGERGSVSYYVSDDPTMFVSNASLFLGGEINGTVEKININDY